MAFLDINDVRPNMVLASDILSQDRRILLRAGVRLNERHIEALKTLGYLRLEITTARSLYRQQPPKPATPAKTAPKKPKISPAKVKAVVQTLTVTRPAAQPLTPDPVLEQKTEAVMAKVFARSKRRVSPAMAEVLRRATLQVVSQEGADHGARRAKAQGAKLSPEMLALISGRINN